MASSRFMRNSPRTASPLNTPLKGSTTPENERELQQETQEGDDTWKEPPLRVPAPSFEDYKGLERHGVLEHMAPLGSMPTQKVRLRVKQYEPPRRGLLVKAMETSAATKEPVKAVEVPVTRRRSESRRVDERSTRTQPLRARDDDQEYNPAATIIKPGVVKSTPTRNSLAPIPSSQTTAGRERLREIVVSAVERARELGNETLGLAVQKLFEESLENRTLAELLDAVLSQRPTPRQATDFQAYIKIARKRIKAEASRSRRSSFVDAGSASNSKSPPKIVDATVARPQGTGLDSTETRSSALTLQPLRSLQPNGKPTGTNGVHEEPRAKRVKRSNSMSSTSSLSSLSSTDPAIDLDQGRNTPQPHSSAHTLHSKHNSKRSRPSQGPRLHQFATGTTGRTSSNRRQQSVPAVAAQVNPKDEPLPDEELAAKRQHFRRSFEDYRVGESDLRTAVTPVAEDTAVPPSRTLSSLQLATMGREGRAGGREDEDDLISAGSSAQGDFLVPPPPGAQRPSRGATPNQQLGRPKKEVRKGARIKISPMKKKSGVVAGIAKKSGGRDKSIGYGFHEELDNVDYCNACGGNGQLLCCDGCTRSFHFKCLDPPMNPNEPPEGQWYCYICASTRDPPPKRSRGLFSALINGAEKHNPVAFNLTVDIRDLYENVKTGEDGEYLDTSHMRAKPREYGAANLLIHDSKGNLILCSKCGKSSQGYREIIACDYCANRYHLDCLDPPVAHPPAINANWKCPAHFDEDLLSFKFAGGDRVIRVRRPKHPAIYDTALRRGHRNNGLIEIENDISDDDEDEESWRTRMPRLLETSIRLDFIDRTKRERAQKAAAARLQNRFSKFRARKRAVDDARETDKCFDTLAAPEKSAILSLLTLGSSPVNYKSADQVLENPVRNFQYLFNSLMAQAHPDILKSNYRQEHHSVPDAKVKSEEFNASDRFSRDIVMRDDGSSEEEQAQLLILQELIRQRLQGRGIVH